MLEIDGFKPFFDVGAFFLYSKDSKNVSIISGDLMPLNGVVKMIAILFELKLRFRM
jgi:hypothetical protein